jgi:hypothetical protein
LASVWYEKLVWAKFLMFYLPVAAMLVGNFVMFVGSVRKIYVVGKNRKELVNGGDRSKYAHSLISTHLGNT